MKNIIRKEIEIGGEKMKFEFSDLVARANGSLIASIGETKVLVTVVMGEENNKLDFFPLRVDYQEKYYAAGEILGGKYRKREGKPSTEAILTGRVIDRSIRPFFNEDLRNEIQVITTVLSIGDYDPDIVALNGVSLALAVSDIPWDGPIGSLRITTLKSGEIKINPDYKFRENDNKSEVLFSGKGNGKISMIESDAEEMLENEFLDLLDKSEPEILKIINFINEIKDEIGKEKKSIEERMKSEEEIKLEKKEEKKRDEIRTNILEKGLRLDGRKIDEIREIYTNADRLSAIVHGTGIFYRGETHVMSFLTIGDLDDALFIDGMEIQDKKNYMHYYNFPPFATGEAGRIGSPKRREIGHGALAEKALIRMLPEETEFPYTMRVVSEVMSSNGSSSMASTCASTLALLSGGVPLKNKVAGIAIGLVSQGDDYKILTDILGEEDHYGDMDFKVTGTDKGITAIQLDIKNNGISREIIEETLKRAKDARLKILENINDTISEPAEMSDKIEKVKIVEIPQFKIGLVIGKGGMTIKKITKLSKARIDIKSDGRAFIFGKGDSIKIATEEIKKIIG